VSDDPFFSLPQDGTWNACIGSQGDELHYLDGYIEAAWELADAVVQKNMLGKRDTLVLPILYNARHAIELLLKYITNQLVECDALAHGHPANHDLQGHYDLLVGAKNTALAQHGVDQGGLAMIDVGDNRDVADRLAALSFRLNHED